MPHPDFDGATGNGNWADLLHQIDQLNGRLLDAIDELGIRDNTLFIFTADNGPEGAPPGNINASLEPAIPGSAGPWRGTLFTGFEGSLRVPFVVRWPGRIPAGSASNEVVHEMDLFPTFARIVGGEVPEDRVIDGVDQTDFLLGNQAESNREGVIVYMGNEIFGVKWRNWKLNFSEMETVYSENKQYNFPADLQPADRPRRDREQAHSGFLGREGRFGSVGRALGVAEGTSTRSARNAGSLPATRVTKTIIGTEQLTRRSAGRTAAPWRW